MVYCGMFVTSLPIDTPLLTKETEVETFVENNAIVKEENMIYMKFGIL